MESRRFRQAVGYVVKGSLHPLIFFFYKQYVDLDFGWFWIQMAYVRKYTFCTYDQWFTSTYFPMIHKWYFEIIAILLIMTC